MDCKQAKVLVYEKSNGRPLGTMKPGPEVSGESEWTDFRDCLRAVQLKSGDYLVIVEEDWKAKNLVYRLENPLRKAVR